MHLSHILLNAEPGQRLPSMQHIASIQEVSVGTVQSAMQYLQREQIVNIESRGRLGAFVQWLDYPRLWALANQRAMTAMLPMPYSKRLEGLATGIRDTFDALVFDLALRFMRGSTARIQRLHTQQCDWVVTSRYAAEAAWVKGFNVEIIMALGVGTYTVDHVLVLNGHEALKAGMRVGIDPHSADHAYVMRQISQGIRVTFVEIDYSTSLDKVLTGEIDATVWTMQDLPVLPSHIYIQQITGELLRDEQFQKLGEAVIVGLPGDMAVAHVVSASLEVNQLHNTQSAVLAGERKPTY